MNRSRVVRTAGVAGNTRTRSGDWAWLRVTDPRSDGWWRPAHGFLDEYGTGPEKIIRAHSALGRESRGYWG